MKEKLQEKYDIASKLFEEIKKEIETAGYIINSDGLIVENEELYYAEWYSKVFSYSSWGIDFYQINSGYEIIGDISKLQMEHFIIMFDEHLFNHIELGLNDLSEEVITKLLGEVLENIPSIEFKKAFLDISSIKAYRDAVEMLASKYDFFDFSNYNREKMLLVDTSVRSVIEQIIVKDGIYEE